MCVGAVVLARAPQYQLPNAATFRYAPVTWGGPGAFVRDGDDEIDAVGGLNVTGGGVVHYVAANALNAPLIDAKRSPNRSISFDSSSHATPNDLSP